MGRVLCDIILTVGFDKKKSSSGNGPTKALFGFTGVAVL